MVVLSVLNFIIAIGITTNSTFTSQLHRGIHSFPPIPALPCAIFSFPLFSTAGLYFDVRDHRSTKGVQTLLQWGGKPIIQRITLSARKRTVGAIVRPRASAVFRLMSR